MNHSSDTKILLNLFSRYRKIPTEVQRLQFGVHLSGNRLSNTLNIKFVGHFDAHERFFVKPEIRLTPQTLEFKI